jgi:hypothetical protein
MRARTGRKAAIDSSSRVTRLGDFWAIFGRLFTFGSFLKYKSSPKFYATFILSIEYVLILTKMGWAKIWAKFSQTHLVTLSSGKVTRLGEVSPVGQLLSMEVF